MKPPIPLVVLLILTPAHCEPSTARERSGNASVPSQAGKILTWTNIEGRAIRGSFIKLAGDAVVILSGGKQFTVPFTKLSQASVEQAKRLAVSQSETAISDVMTMSFRRIRAGTFPMGSPEGEIGRLSDEIRHRVKITEDFDLKETEVTWTEWNAVRDLGVNYGYTDIPLGRNGYDGDASGTHPVTEVSWWDAIKWCNLMSQIQGKTPVYYTAKDHAAANILKTGTPNPHANWDANGYRLPTEAEWEYACREGSSASNRAFYTGKIDHAGAAPVDRCLDSAGWYAGNSGGNTHPVGAKKANRFELLDMHGNVAEWCWDWSSDLNFEGVPPVVVDPDNPTAVEDSDFSRTTSRDPRGPDSGAYRMFRGGSWADTAKCCRSAYRGTRSPITPRSYFVGFRPARSSEPSERK